MGFRGFEKPTAGVCNHPQYDLLGIQQSAMESHHVFIRKNVNLTLKYEIELDLTSQI